jgi:hypothetical protein
MKVGLRSQNQKIHEFRMPAGGATNMARACFGHFQYILSIATLNNNKSSE